MAPTNPSLTTVDLPRIAAAVAEILAAIGEDPARDSLLGARSRSEAMGFITGERAR